MLSLNEDNICKVVAGNGAAQDTIAVEPAKPFALVLPAECSEIIMYDAQDNVVTLYDTK